MTAENIENGDVFRWEWSEAERDSMRKAGRDRDQYWCMSQIAVCIDGDLFDTYWSDKSHGILDLGRVALTFLGNVNKMRVIPEYEKVFYRYEDVVDMRHANDHRAPVYVKPGCGRDQGIMRAYYLSKIEDEVRKIRWANDRIADYRAAVERINSGEIDAGFPLYT